MKLFSLLSLGLLLLAGGASAQYANIIEAAQAAGLTTLAAAVDVAGLTDFLSNGTRALTVFAPTNEAFTNALDALGINQEDLLSSTALLTEVLRLHVLDDRIPSADIAAGSTNLPTLAGRAETQFGLIVTNDGGVTVESYGSTANVTTPDVTAGDSVVHVIDAVLLPFYLNVAQAAQKNGLSALVDAVVAAGLADALSNSSFVGTVFAPTNEAFQLDAESLANISVPTLQRILQYHIIPGQVLYAANITNNTQYTTLEGSPITTELRAGAVGIMANGGAAQVETTDIPVAAGRAVVHTIANVLLPSYPSITQAVTAKNLSDLATAATAAGLGDVLANTATELTVFAPTNEAFAFALSALGLTLDQLADNTQLLTQVLSDHIIAGPGVLSSALSDGQVLQTLGNTTLEVIKNDTGVFIVAPNNGTVVQVITPDVGVAQDRSVVHIVNGVLVDGTLLSPNSTVGPSPSSGPTSAPGTVPAPPPPPGSATSSSWAPMLIAALLAVATWAMH